MLQGIKGEISRFAQGIFNLPEKIKYQIADFRKNIADYRQIQQTANPQFLAFLKRLEAECYRPVDPNLDKLITRSDFLRILKSFSSYGFGSTVLELSKLPVDSALRLHKTKTGFARTLTVLREPNGEYRLILETKSKLRDGRKTYDLLESPDDPEKKLGVCGTYKCGKSAWRIDDLEEWFNNVTRLNMKDLEYDLSCVKEEAQLSQKYNSAYFCRQILGPRYRSVNYPNQEKISMYSKKGTPLDKLIDQGITRQLSLNQQKILIKNILLGLKELHNDGKVYQDLKPNNIIVYSGFYPKLNDFGLVEDKRPLAAKEYQSPEMAYYYSHFPDTKDYQYFLDEAGRKSLGYQFRKRCVGDKSLYAKPHPANDMWAAGIAIFEIKHGAWPRNISQDLALIENDPLLRVLLEPVREKRADIYRALEVFDNIPSLRGKPN